MLLTHSVFPYEGIDGGVNVNRRAVPSGLCTQQPQQRHDRVPLRNAFPDISRRSLFQAMAEQARVYVVHRFEAADRQFHQVGNARLTGRSG